MQPGAHRDGCIRIHGAIVLIDVLNLSVLVHDERGALRKLVIIAFFVVSLQNPILFQDFSVHVAQEGKGHADLLGEGGVRGRRVNANSEYDGIARFQLGQISLIGLKFFRSTTGECQHVKRENHVLFPAIVAQFHWLPIICEQRKIRRRIAHFQVRLGNASILRRGSELACQ
jgi:hypothetical protein